MIEKSCRYFNFAEPQYFFFYTAPLLKFKIKSHNIKVLNSTDVHINIKTSKYTYFYITSQWLYLIII